MQTFKKKKKRNKKNFQTKPNFFFEILKSLKSKKKKLFFEIFRNRYENERFEIIKIFFFLKEKMDVGLMVWWWWCGVRGQRSMVSAARLSRGSGLIVLINQ